MARRRRPKDTLLQTLKTAILQVISDDKATPADKLKAIELGTKLYAAERKHTDDTAESGFFD